MTSAKEGIFRTGEPSVDVLLEVGAPFGVLLNKDKPLKYHLLKIFIARLQAIPLKRLFL
jgi:hypothetical protein